MPGWLFILVWWQLHASMHIQGIIQFKGKTTCLPSAVVSRTCSPRKTEGVQPAWRWDSLAQGHPRPTKTERGPPGNRSARVCVEDTSLARGTTAAALPTNSFLSDHPTGCPSNTAWIRGQPFCAL